MTNKYTWIMLDYNEEPNVLKCLRCKASVRTPMPCLINDAMEMMNAFKKNHLRCKDLSEDKKDG